eukprot:SAG31_NODE_16491_length_707_cov_1.000000_2_plen_121_part_00
MDDFFVEAEDKVTAAGLRKQALPQDTDQQLNVTAHHDVMMLLSPPPTLQASECNLSHDMDAVHAQHTEPAAPTTAVSVFGKAQYFRVTAEEILEVTEDIDPASEVVAVLYPRVSSDLQLQ